MKKIRRTRQLRCVPIDELKTFPKQATMFPPAADVEIETLAASIDERGLDNPVEVTSDLTIIAGHRRVEAHRRLGRKWVLCWVRVDLEKQGEAAIEQRWLEDNLHRQHLSRLTQARAALRLFEMEKSRKRSESLSTEKEDARDRVGKVIGLSGRQLQRYWSILKMPIEIQMAVEQGLSLEFTVKLAEKPQSQKEVARRIREGEDARPAIAACLATGSPKITATPSAVSAFLRTVKRANATLDGHSLDGYTARSIHGQAKMLRRARKYIDQLLAVYEDGAQRWSRAKRKVNRKTGRKKSA